MAQLWVRVDGAPRQVSGAVQTASTADLIRALAQATGKTGKFVLAAVDERVSECSGWKRIFKRNKTG